jgi:hypothetical protein
MEPQGHSKEDIQYYIKKKSLFEDTKYFWGYTVTAIPVRRHPLMEALPQLQDFCPLQDHVTTRM